MEKSVGCCQEESGALKMLQTLDGQSSTKK